MIEQRMASLASMLFALLLISGCQKSDLQACVDAKIAEDKSMPKYADGSWTPFWEGGHHDEVAARSWAFDVCGSVIGKK